MTLSECSMLLYLIHLHTYIHTYSRSKKFNKSLNAHGLYLTDNAEFHKENENDRF